MRDGAFPRFSYGGISRPRPWPSATGRHFESLLPILALVSRTWLFASRILASTIFSLLLLLLLLLLLPDAPHFFFFFMKKSNAKEATVLS